MQLERKVVLVTGAGSGIDCSAEGMALLFQSVTRSQASEPLIRTFRVDPL